jgi:hypothetical protein
MLKAKYVYIRENAEPAPDYICFKDIEEYERSVGEGAAGQEQNVAAQENAAD